MVFTLGLFDFRSNFFEPYQFITHIFMHGSLGHLFFNMLSLYMFGAELEQIWGAKKFLLFYLICGLGAAFLHSAIGYFTVSPMDLMSYQQQLQTPTVGASGAIYGLLMAFGLLFPDRIIILLFFPVKASIAVLILGGMAFLQGMNNASGDNVAHFAHLGGMIFGFGLMKYWQYQNGRYD